MRTASPHLSRLVGVGLLLTLVTALLAVGLGAPAAEASRAPEANAHHSAIAERGTTPGWFDGREITFSYSKDFFCRTSDPESRADSGCIVNVEPVTAPRPGDIPDVYVLVPLFDNTAGLDLHCPVAGDCINHPDTLDLSRVFGEGAENLPLAPHSHVVEEKRGGWWGIEVNGVLTREAWDAIEDAKDLDEVRVQQELGAVTPDLPSNLYLWFNTQG